MRRQVTAIRLRNALDPTRFYRGSSGTGAEKGMPSYAQLGTIVGGGLEPASIVPRKQRASSVVGELVNDARSVSYSKKKFNEVCSKTNSASSEAHGNREAEPISTLWPTASPIIVEPFTCTTRGARPDGHFWSFLFFYFLLSADTVQVPADLQSSFGAAVLLAGLYSYWHPCLPAPKAIRTESQVCQQRYQRAHCYGKRPPYHPTITVLDEEAHPVLHWSWMAVEWPNTTA